MSLWVSCISKAVVPTMICTKLVIVLTAHLGFIYKPDIQEFNLQLLKPYKREWFIKSQFELFSNVHLCRVQTKQIFWNFGLFSSCRSCPANSTCTAARRLAVVTGCYSVQTRSLNLVLWESGGLPLFQEAKIQVKCSPVQYRNTYICICGCRYEI